MAAMTAIEPFDAEFSPPEGSDAQRLHELGYEQELKRGMGIFDSVAMGFATISPVVGLYAVASSAWRSPAARGCGCCPSRSPASAC